MPQCNHQAAVQMIDVMQFPSYVFPSPCQISGRCPGPSPKFSANPRIKSNTKPWCQCFHISICCSNAGILQWLGHHIACWMSCRNLKWATNKKNMWLSFNFKYKVRHIIVIIQVPCFFRLLGSLELPPPKKKVTLQFFQTSRILSQYLLKWFHVGIAIARWLHVGISFQSQWLGFGGLMTDTSWCLNHPSSKHAQLGSSPQGTWQHPSCGP